MNVVFGGGAGAVAIDEDEELEEVGFLRDTVTDTRSMGVFEVTQLRGRALFKLDFDDVIAETYTYGLNGVHHVRQLLAGGNRGTSRQMPCVRVDEERFSHFCFAVSA